MIVWSQFYAVWGFDKKGRQSLGAKVSGTVKGILMGSALAVLIVICIIAAVPGHGTNAEKDWAWIDAVSLLRSLPISSKIRLWLTVNGTQAYAISYVKILVTLIKYMPQVFMNYKRQSTEGFSIAQMILDFTGGVLSNGQLGIDSYIQNDWSGVIGNPVKLLLANMSIFFDICFFIQHYWLYRGAGVITESEEDGNQQDPLLGVHRRRGD